MVHQFSPKVATFKELDEPKQGEEEHLHKNAPAYLNFRPLVDTVSHVLVVVKQKAKRECFEFQVSDLVSLRTNFSARSSKSSKHPNLTPQPLKCISSVQYSYSSRP